MVGPFSLNNLVHDKFYWNLFKGLDARELNWLLSVDPCNSVFVYNHRTRSVERASFNIPWPVLFFLGFRHKKHRYCGPRLPSAGNIMKYVAEAVDKIKWRSFFRNSDDRQLHRIMQYKRKTPRFSGVVPPEVSALCFQMQKEIYGAARFGISRARANRQRWANVLPVERAARDWLAESDWCAVPTDKDGGFTLVAVDAFHRIQAEMLSSSWYQVVGANCVEQTWRAMVPQYRCLAKKIADIDDRVTVQMLNASLAEGSKRLPSQLIHTCKTHKDPGSVVFRPVHSSSRHAFTGIMSWISLILSDVLGKYSHLVNSSDDFLHRITQVKMEENDVLLHMDLKDFFMTGSSKFLVRHASLLVPMRFREVFRSALAFLLENQYVTSSCFPLQLWKVVVGSGMGLKSSSHVSDAAFLHSVELCGLSILSEGARSRFGIVSYTRYRDNLLFVCEPDFDKIRSLKLHIEGSILPYRGSIEEASHIGITFLDLNIVKDERWRRTGVISFNPYLKPTSLLQVLSIKSVHNSSTHGAWMRAYICRLRRNSSCLVWFRTMKEHALFRLRKAGIDHSVVSLIDRASRFTYPVNHEFLQRKQIARRGKSLWVKMPFHPVWSSCVNRGLRRLSESAEIAELLTHFDPELQAIRAAWCLDMPMLGHVVRKF